MKKIQIVFIIIIVFISACKEKTSNSVGLTPTEALSTFQLPDDFKIELVASEPMVSDPVAMEVDESGNIYVVEMHGYPMDTTGLGAVKLLTDTNGDGSPDKSIVFADKLRLPTGIMRWKKGILVVDVPDILYLEDTDGDGKADLRELMITGLALTNPQHIANTPIFGLDNWIYVAHMGTVTPKVAMEFNDTGRTVRYVKYPGAATLPRDADGRNIRFKPVTRELEMLSGESQYGQTFDAWGHHLGTSNADHLFHEAIAARYLKRNSNLLVGNAVDHIPDHGNAAEIYPITDKPEHQLLTDVGVITSSCGVTWYQGGLFPDSFNNITFVAEPVHNLVHADHITDKGATFNATRVYQKKEFLASTDAWFRPVQFYIGPDGALYVLDYYREIIEHPEWMSDSVNNSGRLYNGSDKGRIYRITPTQTGKMNWCGKIKLATASSAELVHMLASKNIWWRRNAQRLLLDKTNPQNIPLLAQLIDTTSVATAVAHGLWCLQELGGINETVLRKALHHKVPGVRENAIKIAELHLSDLPQLKQDLLLLNDDEDAKVRYQLLCTLGYFNDEVSENVRLQLLKKDIEDKWVHAAALSSSAGKEYALLEKIIPVVGYRQSEGRKLFFESASAVIGVSQRIEEIKKLVALGTAPVNLAEWWQASILKGLTKALRQKPSPADFSKEKHLLLALFNKQTAPKLRTAALDLLNILHVEKDALWQNALASAKKVAVDKNESIEYRIDAIRIIGWDKDKSHSSIMEQLIIPTEEETIQQAALNSYKQVAPNDAGVFILKNWKNLTPGIREAAIGILLSSVDNMNLLLNAVEKGQVQTSAISWPRMVQLMNNNDLGVRNKARQLLVNKIEDRDEVYRDYQPALSMKGDASNGVGVFARVCSGCHQVGEQYGNPFGPDLASIRNRDMQFILADIVNPNRTIADKYEMWTILKTNGEKLNGIISSETPSVIAIRNIGMPETVIARNDIKTLTASDTSAMPPGLERSITVKEMADLLAFLKNIH